MKKIFYTLILTTSIFVFGQKKELKQAQKLLDQEFYNEALSVLDNNKDEDIRSLQITYANTTKPSTAWDSEKTVTANKLQQRYLDTIAQTGILYSEGGAETYDEWRQRGQYYCYSFKRDKDDRSTYVSVRIDFGESLGSKVNLFLCSHYDRVVRMSVDRGFITDVQAQNM